MTENEKVLEVLEHLNESGKSEALSIGALLQSTYEEGDLTLDMATSILLEFKDWASHALDMIDDFNEEDPGGVADGTAVSETAGPGATPGQGTTHEAEYDVHLHAVVEVYVPNIKATGQRQAIETAEVKVSDQLREMLTKVKPTEAIELVCFDDEFTYYRVEETVGEFVKTVPYVNGSNGLRPMRDDEEMWPD